MRRLSVLAVLAVLLSGCAASPQEAIRDDVNSILTAANNGNPDGVRSAVDTLLNTLRAQVAGQVITQERADRLRELARAIAANAGDLTAEPTPSPLPTPSAASPTPSPSPSPTPSPSPSPSPSPDPEPSASPSPEPLPSPSPVPIIQLPTGPSPTPAQADAGPPGSPAPLVAPSP